MKSFLLATLMLFTLQSNSQDFWEEIGTPDIDDKIINSCLAINHDSIILGTSSFSTNGGLYSTNNSGESWNFHDLTPYNDHGYSTSYYNGCVYAFIDGSFFKKESATIDWVNIGNDHRAGPMVFINDNTIFKGHGEGINKSTDGGYTWERVYSTHPNESVETIVQHPNGDLFFGTYTFDANAVPGVYRSTDTGETWGRIGLERNQILSLAVDSNGALYAGSIGEEFTAIGGVYKSEDLGVTWDTLVQYMGVRSLVVTSGDTIFAGTNLGVHSSADEGNSWTEINSGLSRLDVRELSLGGDGHIYAIIDGSEDMLFRSTTAVTGIGGKPESTEPAISLYPNPASSQLHISVNGQHQPAGVAIINMQGQILAQQTLQLPGTITIGHLPTGIYMLRLQTEATIYTQQFIKN